MYWVIQPFVVCRHGCYPRLWSWGNGELGTHHLSHDIHFVWPFADLCFRQTMDCHCCGTWACSPGSDEFRRSSLIYAALLMEFQIKFTRCYISFLALLLSGMALTNLVCKDENWDQQEIKICNVGSLRQLVSPLIFFGDWCLLTVLMISLVFKRRLFWAFCLGCPTSHFFHLHLFQFYIVYLYFQFYLPLVTFYPFN